MTNVKELHDTVIHEAFAVPAHQTANAALAKYASMDDALRKDPAPKMRTAPIPEKSAIKRVICANLVILMIGAKSNAMQVMNANALRQIHQDVNRF